MQGTLHEWDEEKYREDIKGKEPLGRPRSRQRKISKWIGWGGLTTFVWPRIETNVK